MSEPSIGIFWSVPAGQGAALVTDKSALAESEVYGEFLTHPRGHYDVWEGWRSRGPAWLAGRGLPTSIMWREYEDCPRGRIVFHNPSGLFVVYADPSLQNAKAVAMIVAAFGLGRVRYEVRGDGHYCTSPV